MKRSNIFLQKVLFAMVLLFPMLSITAQEFKTVAYIPTYRFDLADQIQFEKVTHLNISFANPDINGDLSTNGIDVEPIVSKGHEAGCEVLIALGGAGAVLEKWEPWISESNRSEFIHNIIEYTKTYNLQGIDMDLEWANVTDDYSGFVIELKDSMITHNLIFSVAFPGTHRYPQVSDEALAVFDWINIMAYDLTGPWTANSPGPHSPYSFASQSISFWKNQGVAKDKLALGIPFYGYDFTNSDNVTAYSYGQIVAMDESNAYVDEVGLLYYNGLNTVEEKTKLALADAAGVMIWELGQDHFSEYSLLSKIDSTIKNYVPSDLENINDNKYCSVYPNPGSNYLIFDSSAADELTYVLYSVEGKVVMSENGFGKHTIQTAELNNGIYFYTVLQSGEIIHQGKWVKE